jgi:hypothetical protein
MYKISKMEKVFNKNKAMNHFLWEFLAAFQRATPFQGKSQKTEKRITKSKVLGSNWAKLGI